MGSKGGLKWRKPGLKPIKTIRVDDKLVYEVEEEPLSPSARLFHEPNFNVYIIAIMGCKTRINPDVIFANVPDTLVKHPRFSSLQVTDEKGQMKWVPTTVDPRKHVVIPEIDETAMASPEKWVEDYISNLTKTTIDKSKPLWDVHFLNIKTKDAESFGVFRIHHSLGDGTSLMSLLLACSRQVDDPNALPTVPMKKVKKKGTKGSRVDVLWWVWRCVLAAWLVVQCFWNTVVDVFMFVATAWFLKDTATPLTGPPGVENLPRRFIWRTVSLDDMKFIKNAMNLTINDVALGVTQAALSRYLNRKFGNNLPKKIRLRSTLLINLRPATGIQALADMMEKDAEVKWGNWIGFVLLPFTIGIRKDPLDYVREAKATIDRKKRSLEAVATFSLSEIALKLFGTKKSHAISHRVITHTTLCFSSLVGPLEEIGFHGHPMEFLAPSSFNQPHALMINFQSYVNKMTIVLSVEDNTIPDAHELCDDIVESLQLIKDAVVSQGLVKE